MDMNDDGMGLVSQPPLIPVTRYTDPEAAVRRLTEIYARNTAFIRKAFEHYASNGLPPRHRVRACYPAIRIRVDTWQEVDSRLSYGHVAGPGTYMTTDTQPAQFGGYPEEQIALLVRTHALPAALG